MGHILSTGRNTLALNSADGKPTTASMTGDLYLGPGDTFEVRATPTAADRLDVNGKAQIHGTVSVVAGTGTYAESTRYTILTAQTLSNKFMSTTSNLAYLKPTVANEGNTVVLTLALRQAPKPDPDPDPVTPTRPIRFEDLADTSNQRAAARGSRACPPAIRCTRPCSTCPWARPRRRSPRCPAKLMPATPHRYATSPTRPRCCRWNTSAAT